ncbi:SMP-30/gluconolactonase/LRE family protein [Acidovorax sp. LjRoot117]|uniref:SMP-30/gluconolactonase/LRE family protein n=1 Tax=Acidovorax sp. LjRoot117 TaxID=3342255 RepID=UPI003ECCBA10
MTLERLPLPPSELGESPFWQPEEKSLYWCDIQGHTVNAWNPANGEHRQWKTPSEPACCAPSAGGNIVIGLRDGFYQLDTASGDLTLLALLPPDQHDTRHLRLNDGRCDAAGRFWAGSMITPRTAPDAALWCLSAAADGTGYTVRHMAGDNFTANGLAFSPDNRVMYWSNTPEHRIDRFDFDLATGAITHRRPWVHFDRKVDGQPYGGRPDGAAVDVEGNYWVAMYEGACVLQLSPKGDVLQRIAVPVQCPTMVCFGGEDLSTLYITSARAGRPAEEQEAEVPAGSLFSVAVDTTGLAVQKFTASTF